ncbi:ribonuclease HII [Sphingomonas sp. IC081]|nr:ribonuclease HII [Sphingomonas sp. IC081]QSR18762.1 ribonuclease HII [Novosphingobium sp. KA1]
MQATGDTAARNDLEFFRLVTSSKSLAASAPGRLIIGVDEAGRGPLAGPVVAGAVVLCKPRPAGLDDSKKLSARRRAELEEAIKRRCRWAVGVVDVEEIDRLNIFGATMLAMTRAVAALCAQLGEEPDEVLIDGNMTPQGRTAEWRWKARAIVGGDAVEPCISAASIIAKEHRDRIMRDLALVHPHYGWERNAGYGTAQHLEALRVHGPTIHHRRSFAPVAQLEMML